MFKITQVPKQTFLISILLYFTIFYIPISGNAQEIIERLIVTGNIADIHPDSKAFDHLKDLLQEENVPTKLIIAGDMIKFPAWPTVHVEDSIRLVNLFRKTSGLACSVFLVPGDRDWNSSKKYGWESVLALEKFVARQGFKHVNWMIQNGCPGPTVVDFDEQLRIIAIQTQWWNHPYDRPEPADALCKFTTKEDFLEELEDAIKEAGNKNVFVIGHYPVLSYGSSGGRISAKTHIFPFTEINPKLYIPLPVLGSLYASFRQNIGTSNDVTNEQYEEFRKELNEIMYTYSSVVYASAHESNMQLLLHGNSYFSNSGSIGKSEFVGRGKEIRYRKSTEGVTEFRYLSTGEVSTHIHKYLPETGFSLLVKKFLYQSPCNFSDSLDSLIPLNTVLGYCGDNPFELEDGSDLFDSIISKSAGPEYEAGPVKKAFFGRHYRKDWTAEVKVPYINLDTVGGGLELAKVGGGSQTLSLKFKGNNKKEYAFRSVNKDPITRVDYDLRQTVIGVIVRDQTSSQQPYGALTLPPMMEALDILHVKPKLYVLPPDSKLAFFQGAYSNMMGFLEENPKVDKKKGKEWKNAKSMLQTYRFYSELYRDPDAIVDKYEYAKARMFDILIGDCGREEDNWKWAGYPSGDQMLYRPVPRDRDQAFYLRDGFFPWISDFRFIRPEGEDFKRRIQDMKSLTYTGRYVDRIIGGQLTRQDWLAASREIRLTLSDSIIESAIKLLPPESYEKSGKEIIQKLKARRDDLEKYGEKFHRILSREVNVLGSNKNEYFEIQRNKDGSVEVFMFDRLAGEEPRKGSNLYYHRKFLKSETHEIHIFGLGGDDVFLPTGKSFSSITVRIIGGPGDDIIKDSSRVFMPFRRTRIYEQGDNAIIEKGKEGIRIRNVPRESFNFVPTSFSYAETYPLPLLSYNRDDGPIFSMGMLRLNKKYGKEDYSSRHTMRAAIALNSSYTLRYHGRWNRVLGEWDVDLLTQFANPSRFFYFFGVGNETVKNDSLFNLDFYGSRYNQNSTTFGLIRDFWKKSELYIGAKYDNNEPQLNDSSILFTDAGIDVFGKDKANILSVFAYLDLDFRDNEDFPTKGMRIYLEHDQGLVLNNKDNTGSRKTFGSIEYHVPFRTPLPLFLSLQAGGGISEGKIPFYNLFRLGNRSNLRGYFRNRFTGHAMAYANSELRLELLNMSAISIPWKFGLKGFYDIGRVYADGETSAKWHAGFGGGIYIIPYLKKITISATLGFSEEESMFLQFSVGVPFR